MSHVFHGKIDSNDVFHANTCGKRTMIRIICVRVQSLHTPFLFSVIIFCFRNMNIMLILMVA